MKVAILFVAGIVAVVRADAAQNSAITLSLESSPVIFLEKPQGDKFVDPWGKPLATGAQPAGRSWWSSRLFDLPGPGYRTLRQEPEDNTQ